MLCVFAYHGSMSLFEPLGMLSVTNTVFPCFHLTFSTYCASVGCLRS